MTANAGALTFRVEVPGQAAHGSTRYERTSAIDACLPLHRALARLEAARNVDPHSLMAAYPIPYPLSVGTVAAGDWASSVPDLLVAEGRLGVQLGEDPADARAALEECIADACAADAWLRTHPAVVTWSGGQYASGRMPGGHPLAALVGHAHADVTGGGPPAERGAPYGAQGIPPLQYGPGDVRRAHGPQEQVDIAEVVIVTRVLVLAALRTVGTR